MDLGGLTRTTGLDAANEVQSRASDIEIATYEKLLASAVDRGRRWRIRRQRRADHGGFGTTRLGKLDEPSSFSLARGRWRLCPTIPLAHTYSMRY